MISEAKPGEEGEFLGEESPKKTVSRGNTRKNKKKKSDDVLFYFAQMKNCTQLHPGVKKITRSSCQEITWLPIITYLARSHTVFLL